MFPMWNISCISYLSQSICHKHLLFTMGTKYQFQYCSWVWPKTATLYHHWIFLDYLFFQTLPWLSLAIPTGIMRDAASVPFCIFQWQMLGQLKILLAVNVDRPVHTSCLQIYQQTHEVCIEVSYIDACISYSWKLLLPFQEFGFFTRIRFVVPMLSFCSLDAFQESSHVNIERSEQSDGAEY